MKYLNQIQSKSTQSKSTSNVLQSIPIMEIKEKGNKRYIFNNFESSDRIFLHPEVADRKIVVFLTLGAFRKGKSFFLDYCLRYLYANYRSINNPGRLCPTDNWIGTPDQPLKGFSWKHGRDADTKGIIMWSDVFLHETSSGEKLAIVVMDTQGLFEGGSTTNENARIFGLCTLIASIQVLNLQHLIQEDQLEYLNMAVSLSQMVMEKIQKESGNKSSKFFQKLIFLLRDWTDESIAFGYKGGDVYLAETLNKNFKSETATSVREHINQSFDEIKCCLLPHPGKTIGKSDFDGSYGKLDEEFVTSLKEFIESILAPRNLNVKSILGREVTGKEFRGYLNSYFEAFRSDEIPEVESVLDVIVQKQIQTIMETCIQAYHKEIKNAKVDFDVDNRDKFCDLLIKAYNTAKEKVMKTFKTAPKLKASSKDYEAELVKKIDAIFENWKADNLKVYDNTIELKRSIKMMELNEKKMSKEIKEFKDQVRKQSEKNESLNTKIDEITAARKNDILINSLNTTTLKDQINTLKNNESDLKRQITQMEDKAKMESEKVKKNKEEADDLKRQITQMEKAKLESDEWKRRVVSDLELAQVYLNEIRKSKRELKELKEQDEQKEKKLELFTHIGKGLDTTVQIGAELPFHLTDGVVAAGSKIMNLFRK